MKNHAPAKILVAICSCQSYGAKQDGVRNTWLKTRPEGIDYIFFVGRGEQITSSDMLVLEAADTYEALPAKVHQMFCHVLEHHAFDYLFKCDDDTYVVLDRLSSLTEFGADLVGDENGEAGWPCGGAGYLLSRRAVQSLASEPEPANGPEDKWVAQTVNALGLQTVISHRLQGSCHRYPRLENDLISAHHCSPKFLSHINSLFDNLGHEQILKGFQALHQDWRGKIELLKDGLFLGGLNKPHGQWNLLEDGELLVLRWFHWDEQVLRRMPWGYCANALQLVSDDPDAHRTQQDYVRQTAEKLHIGDGSNQLAGWGSFDFDSGSYKALPFSDGSVQLVFAEHAVQRLKPEEAWSFFKEVRRVLRPGGGVRVIVPCLDLIYERYDEAYARFLQSLTGNEGSLEFAMESIICRWRHQAVWTVSGLRAMLGALGFQTWESSAGISSFAEAMGIDGHAKRIGVHPNWVESGVIEALKPDAPDSRPCQT